jgi:hypothetical protein
MTVAGMGEAHACNGHIVISTKICFTSLTLLRDTMQPMQNFIFLVASSF